MSGLRLSRIAVAALVVLTLCPLRAARGESPHAWPIGELGYTYFNHYDLNWTEHTQPPPCSNIYGSFGFWLNPRFIGDLTFAKGIIPAGGSAYGAGLKFVFAELGNKRDRLPGKVTLTMNAYLYHQSAAIPPRGVDKYPASISTVRIGGSLYYALGKRNFLDFSGYLMKYGAMMGTLGVAFGRSF